MRCYGKAGRWWTLEHFRAATPASESRSIMPGKWWPSGTTIFPTRTLFFPTATQMRTFVWQRGEIQDIGTLGGPDAAPGPGCNNQRSGVIVGASYTSFTPNAASGVPTIHPFLWDNGTMTDLGSLGGTHSEAQCINNRGQVIGWSNLSGDSIRHAFLWQNGHMQDLGT